ncbi:MAG: hypothetical protein ACRCTW_12060 [Lactococcus garvieae]
MPYLIIALIWFCFLTVCTDKLLKSVNVPKSWWNRKSGAKYKNQIFIGILFASLLWPITAAYTIYCWLVDTDDED